MCMCGVGTGFQQVVLCYSFVQGSVNMWMDNVGHDQATETPDC